MFRHRRWLASWRYRAVTRLSDKPSVYYPIRRFTGTFDGQCVGPRTDIVIEGYPRSANSTTVAAFLARQRQVVNVAHHKHHAAQILRGVDLGLPVVCLLREPRDAVVSHLGLIAEAQFRAAGVRGLPALPVEDALRGWWTFYSAVTRVVDHVVVTPFEHATSDVDAVIAAIDNRFGTRFSFGSSVPRDVETLGWHAMPNDVRAAFKADIDAAFDARLKNSARLGRALAESDDVYQWLRKRAPA